MKIPQNIFKSALDHHFCGVLILDRNLKILYANQHVAAFLMTGPKPLCSLDIYQILQRGLIDRSCSLEVKETKKQRDCTVKNRQGRIAHIYSCPVLTPMGEIDYIFTYGQYEPFYGHTINGISQFSTGPFSPPSAETVQSATQGFVAESPVSKKIFDLAYQVAPSDASVMLYGESGTGKEVVANYIYRNSRRSQEAFICVNCSAIPESLAESEFFGYEGGAFTGARAIGKLGLFELANRGTLFLDEVGEMPLSLQPKFLRVLESKRFRRIGGLRDLEADVRIIAATNKDLRQMANDALFRSDLFYRLNVIPIEVPPLRQRPEDILALSQLFLTRLNQAYMCQKRLSQDLISYILRYSWPGNIRELKNFIERLYITSPSDILELVPGIFPTSEPVSTGSRVSQNSYTSEPKLSKQTLCDAVANFERSYISTVLEYYNYNVSKTAKSLGMHRTSLYQRLQKYGLDRK